MFAAKPTDPSELDKAILQVHAQLADETPESKEYAQMVDQLTKLYALKKESPSMRVSADTLAIVLGNLAGIIVIVGYERASMVTSKALNLVIKAVK